MSRQARPSAVGRMLDKAILELPLDPQHQVSPETAYIPAAIMERLPLQEFPHEFADGHRTLMTYNPETGMSKLRDISEVLTVPFQRRREYAAWLRKVANRLEAIRPGEMLEESGS
jgi:hypothetical protein